MPPLGAPRTSLLAGGLIAAAGAMALHLGLAPEALLWLAPVLLVAGPLLAGRFPGERALAACRARRALPRAVARPSVAARRPAVRRIGGGRLIALRLAERAPP